MGFATPQGLETLAESRYLIADGEFTRVTRTSRQLWTVHGGIRGWTPCLYVIMSTKWVGIFIIFVPTWKKEKLLEI